MVDVLKKFTQLIVWILLLFLFPLKANGIEVIVGEEKNTCVVCHSEKQEQFKTSVHYENGVVCSDCHGGDPAQVEWEKAMDKSKGFKAGFAKQEIALVCDRCHGNYALMRQYGIPTDQLESYRTSEHGKALFERNNTNVAVCTDCHGVHEILSVKNPQAAVYPLNIPATCEKCHADKKLMAPYGNHTDIVENYRKGIHGKRLLEDGDIGAPTCVTCHGNHGAAPPGVAEVVNVCGRCHANTRDYFEQSAHFNNGIECVNCHDNHRNVHPTDEKFKSSDEGGCLLCHDLGDDTPASKFIKDLTDRLERARLAVKDAEKEVKKAEQAGVIADAENLLLIEARAALTKWGPIQHSLSRENIEAVLQEASSKSEHIEENIDKYFKEQMDRHIKISIAMGFVFIVMLLVYLKYRVLKASLLRAKQAK
ncbi:MAG: cytochrome c3 family protein [bacterium]